MGEMRDEIALSLIVLDELRAQLAERYAEIAQLKAQVAELQAWKDAIPAKAISRILTKHAPFDSEDADIVWKWLKPTR